MIAIPIHDQTSPIRKMNPSHDLAQIANLIETCFPLQKDPDGQAYLDKIRKAARDMQFFGWLSPWEDLTDFSSSGFVWEEDDRIVGNLSLIPFNHKGRRFHLIANVAVDPRFRHRGIARALTQRAVTYLRGRHEHEVWLQVRTDNEEAQRLYRSAGFQEQAVRTTWRIRPDELIHTSESSGQEVILRARRNADWELQSDWLNRAYPQHIQWNLPVSFNRFKPGIIQRISNLIEGDRLRHWAVERNGECMGMITWQKTNAYANNLWLAFPAQTETDILPQALVQTLSRLSSQHPLSIDYPQGRFQTQFKAMGFSEFRTLIWMKCPLNE